MSSIKVEINLVLCYVMLCVRCMWRALVVGIAYHDRKAMLKADPNGYHREIDKYYKKICRHGSAFQTRLAEELKEETQTQEGTFDAMLIISNHVHRNITVLNLDVAQFVQYRTRDQCVGEPFEETLYLLNRPGENHYDCVTSITGFLACGYYCEPCNVRTSNKNYHRCPGNCRVCLAREHTIPIPKIQCDHCHRFFLFQDCYDKHKVRGAICHKRWK